MKKFMKLAVVGMCLSLAITGLVANGQGEEEVAETEKPVRIWYHSGLEPSLHKTLFSRNFTILQFSHSSWQILQKKDQAGREKKFEPPCSC